MEEETLWRSWFLRLRPRVLPIARRVLDIFPLRPLGVLVAIGIFVALKFFAFQKLDLVYLVLGYLGIGIFAIALLTVIAGAILTAYRFRRVHSKLGAELDTHMVYATGVSQSSLWFMPFLSVRWEFDGERAPEIIETRKFSAIQESLSWQERCHVHELRRRVSVSDVFGLARIRFAARESLVTEVRPNTGALENIPALLSLAGGDDIAHPMGFEDGDRIELRRYGPGDPARFIHWKMYARTRKLVVRKQERALMHSRRTVAYLVAGPQDEATAAAARVAFRKGAFGDDWVFGADGTARDMTNVSDVERAIVQSIEARERGGVGLEAFLSRAEKEGPATAIVFLPPFPGPWLDRVLAACKRRTGTRAVVAIDAVTRAYNGPAWRKFLFRFESAVGTRAEALDEVLRALKSARIEVTLLERTTGKVLGDAHRRAIAGNEQGKAA